MVTKAEIVLEAKDATQAAFASVSRGFDGLEAKAFAAKNSAQGVVGNVTGIVTALGGAFALAQGKSLIDMLDGLDDMAEKTGISAEKLSELRYAGEAAGTPMEALGSGFSRLAKLMGEAAGGSKDAAAAFKTLGVEYKNGDGSLRDTDEVLGDLADKFAGYEDGAAKAALAQKIFGKSGAEMIPLLNQGRQGIADLKTEAQQLGAIFGGDLAKEAANFNDNLKKLELGAQAAAVSVGGPLLKSLNGLLTQVLELKKVGSLELFAKDAVMGFLDPNLSKLSLSGEGDVKRLMQQREKVQAQIDKTFKNATPTALGKEMAANINAPLQRELAELDRFLEVAKTRQRVSALAGASPDDANDAVSRRFNRPEVKTQAPVVPSGGGGKDKKEKDPEEAAKRYLETLQKQIEKATELSNVEMALTEIQRIRGDGGKVTEAEKQRILVAAAALDIDKERDAAKKKSAQDQEEAQRRFMADQDEARRVIESSFTPLEAYNQKLAELAILKAKGVLTSEQYSKAIAREAAAYGEAQAQADEARKNIDQFAQRGAQNIQDSLGQGLYDILDGNFDDIGKSFGNMIKRMVAEAAAAKLSRELFGDLVQGGSGSGIFGTAIKGFGAVLGFGGSGGYTPAQQAGLDGLVTGIISGKREKGGPVSAGATYLVGEKVEELFTPSTSGTIIPNHELGGGQSLSLHYAPVFQVDSRTDRGAAIADMQKVAAQSNKDLIADLKRRKVLPQ